MDAGGPVKKRRVANPLGLAVLSLLWERPMHPYEMAATLRERGKEQSIRINYGSLYAVVQALLRAGFVVARETSREGARPERTVYAITGEGQAELDDWLRELLRRPVKEYPQFEAALSLMPGLPPAQVAALLEERVRELERRNEELSTTVAGARRQGLERLFLVEAEYSLAMQEAERRFVVDLLALVRGSPDFTRTWEGFHRERAARAAQERQDRRTAESKGGERGADDD